MQGIHRLHKSCNPHPVFYTHNMNHSFLTLTTLTALCMTSCHKMQAQNALSRAAHPAEYNVEANITASNGDAPFWLTANRYGVTSTQGSNGYLRASLIRNAQTDSTHKWRIGYGADLTVGYNQESTLFVQQLYADFQYKLVNLTVGAKQEPMAFKNAELSTGSQTLGINAHPVPAIRFSLPQYWNISGKGNWAAIRGHISYGLLTDGGFQQSYIGNHTAAHYAKNVLLHTKAGYLRLGNAQKFPIVFEGGIEMATQFGGTSYNTLTWNGVNPEPIKMKHGVKDFVNALFGTGSDGTDGNGYANAAGNTLGSWMARLTWHGADWSLSTYYDHFFEDHSQMFLQYGWLDGMVGIEATLPKNRFVDHIVYEFVKTTYQSGPIYHDHTPEIEDQISGQDNYYNHNMYAGWQHWGQALGNPLFVSPLYNHTADLTFTSNRFRAHHIGFSGNPTETLHYRLLYTHQRSLGTYSLPFDHARTLNSFMAEVGYAPQRIGKLHTKGWQVKAAFALDRGSLLQNNTGFQFSLSKTGLLTH